MVIRFVKRCRHVLDEPSCHDLAIRVQEQGKVGGDMADGLIHRRAVVKVCRVEQYVRRATGISSDLRKRPGAVARRSVVDHEEWE